MSMIPVKPADVRSGDIADHKSRILDPRLVVEVDHAARTVCLRIGTVLTDPVPRRNYTYRRGVQ